MRDDIKNLDSRVDRSANGTFHAFWRGQVVYENGKVREFDTERDALGHFERCNAAGMVSE
jgi:hypothetical protein